MIDLEGEWFCSSLQGVFDSDWRCFWLSQFEGYATSIQWGKFSDAAKEPTLLTTAPYNKE